MLSEKDIGGRVQNRHGHGGVLRGVGRRADRWPLQIELDPETVYGSLDEWSLTDEPADMAPDQRPEGLLKAQASVPRALLDIQAERATQNMTWGGASHDDEHAPADWISFLWKHIQKIPAEMLSPASFYAGMPGIDAYRRQMVRVAALAVAAIESLDRASGGAG